jgi:hypothetical protein
MQATPAKLHAGGTQPQGPAASRAGPDALLTKSLKGALENYLAGRKLVRVQIRHVDGSRTEGFLKIEGGKGERLLVDFKATTTPQGRLSFLEVGGKKISLDDGATTKQVR